MYASFLIPHPEIIGRRATVGRGKVASKIYINFLKLFSFIIWLKQNDFWVRDEVYPRTKETNDSDF